MNHNCRICNGLHVFATRTNDIILNPKTGKTSIVTREFDPCAWLTAASEGEMILIVKQAIPFKK